MNLNELQMSSHDGPVPVDAVTGLLSAFSTHSLVALGEAHWLQQEADFIAGLLNHPDFAWLVQIVVVEFGNAYYQPVIDRYVAGDSVRTEELKGVWRNAGGAGQAFESPIYAQFFQNVRALNQSLPANHRIRVLLGDPPVPAGESWRRSLGKESNPRDVHYARMVEREVIARGQRALLIAGGGHFTRFSDTLPHEGNVVQRLEQHKPGGIFVVLPHVIFEETLAVRREDAEELDRRLADWPIPALATVHGTWLGDLDAFLHCDNLVQVIEPDGVTRQIRVPYIAPDGAQRTEIKLGEMIDALLYLGPQPSLIFTPPSI